MSDGARQGIVDMVVLHHAVSDPMNEWGDIDVQDWFDHVGANRGYAGIYSSAHKHPSRDKETFSQAHYCLHRYTKDDNKYGWRLTPLIDDVWNNVTWHAGNWEVNVRSIGIETAGNFLEQELPIEACKLIADTFREHDKSINGALRICGHQEFYATACPGRIMEAIPTIIDLINTPPTDATIPKKSGIKFPSWGLGKKNALRDFVISDKETPLNKLIPATMSEQPNIMIAQAEQFDKSVISLKSWADEVVKQNTTLKTENLELKEQNTLLNARVLTLEGDLKSLTDKVNEVIRLSDLKDQKISVQQKVIDDQSVQITGLNKAIANFQRESHTISVPHETLRDLEKIVISKHTLKDKWRVIRSKLKFVLLNTSFALIGTAAAYILATLQNWTPTETQIAMFGGSTAALTLFKEMSKTLLTKGTVIAQGYINGELSEVEGVMDAFAPEIVQ